MCSKKFKVTSKIADDIDISIQTQLIRIVDSFGTRWKVVDGCETSALADESEDEKRIAWVQNQARQIVKTQRLTRQWHFHLYLWIAAITQ